jgi:hypothetical protein
MRKLLPLIFLILTSCAAKDVYEELPPATETVSPTPVAVLTLSNYLAQPPIEFKRQIPDVRGIYVTSSRAGSYGSSGYLADLIKFCNDSGVNAMVIDVRTEDGLITFKGIELADKNDLVVENIPDIRKTIALLKENNIYPIARVVAFKDNSAHKIKPELYIHNQDGSLWRDNKGETWLNPYNIQACEYVLEFAKAAAELGFLEIQFDYVRFAASRTLEDADVGDTGGRTRIQAITDFVKLAVETLHKSNVQVSADVYGAIINSDVDADIVGQDYLELSKLVDVICPMVYPSHYANGSMGIDIPDLLPYDTIYKSMELSNERLSVIPKTEHRAIVRPWLQDFTASWLYSYLEYDGAERSAQIQGAYDAGLTQWLLWDPFNNYNTDGIAAPETKIAAAD